jgi:clan AA aspartic protease (TIGR02281 family)
MRFQPAFTVVRPLTAFLAAIIMAGTMAGFSVAHAQDLNAQVDEATHFFRTLASQSENPLIAGLARENLDRLEHGSAVPSRQIIIPLLEQPDASLVVPTMLNDQVMGTFLVDTGSSYTVITPQMAHKLGVVIGPDTPKTSIITANGTIKAPMVTLRNVSIGQLRIPSVTAIVQEIGNGDDLLLSGLLGMNVFQGMDLTVKEDQLIIVIRDNKQAMAR